MPKMVPVEIAASILEEPSSCVSYHP